MISEEMKARALDDWEYADGYFLQESGISVETRATIKALLQPEPQRGDVGEAIERLKRGISKDWGFSLDRASSAIAKDIETLIQAAQEAGDLRTEVSALKERLDQSAITDSVVGEYFIRNSSIYRTVEVHGTSKEVELFLKLVDVRDAMAVLPVLVRAVREAEKAKQLWHLECVLSEQLRARIQELEKQRPEMIPLRTLLKENGSYHPHEGFKGVYEDAVHNWKNGLRAVMAEHPRGLIISEE